MKGRMATAMMLVCGALPVAAQQKVPLVLNHLTIVLDSATYQEIRNSPFIVGQLAAVDTGYLLGHEGGPGIRLMGKYNFLTFLPPAAAGITQADMAIVVATETPGDLDRLGKQGAFRDEPALAIRGEGRRPEQYEDISARILPSGDDTLSSRVKLAFMEYGAASVHAAARLDSLPDTNLSSVRFLAHFFDASRLFSYLTGATLAIPVADITRIVRVSQRDGVPVVVEGEGAIVKLDGFTLHLVPPFAGAGVRQLQFALMHGVGANPVYRFGPRSQLRFGPGAIAVWDFKS
jgi:hypothetical protein